MYFTETFVRDFALYVQYAIATTDIANGIHLFGFIRVPV